MVFTNGVLTTVAAGFTMLDPILSRLAGNLAAAQSKHCFCPDFNEGQERVDCRKLHAELTELESRVKGQLSAVAPSSIKRLSGYSLSTDNFDHKFFHNADLIRKGQRAALQSISVAEVSGSTKIVMASMSMVTGINMAGRRRSADTLLANGSITNCAGTSIAAGFQLMNLVRAELKRQQLKKHNELPSQLLNTRLKELESIESSLKLDLKPLL